MCPYVLNLSLERECVRGVYWREGVRLERLERVEPNRCVLA